VPAAAVVKVFVDELLEAYRHSALFQGEEPLPAGPPDPAEEPPPFP
jgi:hypothetical protein